MVPPITVMKNQPVKFTTKINPQNVDKAQNVIKEMIIDEISYLLSSFLEDEKEVVIKEDNFFFEFKFKKCLYRGVL